MLRAGEDDQVGAVQVFGRLRPAHRCHLLQRFELIEVGSKGIANHRYNAGWRRAAGSRLASAILVRQLVLKPGNHADHRDPGRLGDSLWSRCQQRDLAAELVEDETAKALSRLARYQRPGPVEMCEGTSAIDISHKEYRSVCRGSCTSVRHIDVHQVDFRRTSRALKDHDVICGKQRFQRFQDRRPEARSTFPPWPRRDFRIRLSQQHNLATRHPFRLDEYWVHPDIGGGSCGQSLEVLCGPDLAALYDTRVVGHVLGLERRHSQALPGKVAAQGCGDKALTRPARCSLHHERTHVRVAYSVNRPNGYKAILLSVKRSLTTLRLKTSAVLAISDCCARNGSGRPKQLAVDHCSATHLRSTFACVRVGAVGGVARAQIVVVGQFLTGPYASPRMHEYPIPLDRCLAVGVAGMIHEPDAVALDSRINREAVIAGEQSCVGGIRIAA